MTMAGVEYPPSAGTALLAKEGDGAAVAKGPHAVGLSLQLRGYALIAAAAVILSVRATAIHAILSRTDVPTITSLLTHAVSCTSLSWGVMAWGGVSLRGISRKAVLQLIIRGILSGAMLYFNLLTLQNISVGTALTLFATAPAIATVLSLVFLREPVDAVEVVFLAVNMAGVYLVASPTSILPESVSGAKTLSPKVGLMCAFLCAFLMAAIFTLVRAMGGAVHYSLNVLASGVGTLAGFVVLADAETLVGLRRNWVGYVGLQAISLFNFSSQALLNYAMQFVRTGPALVVRSLNVPVSFVLGFAFLGERATGLEGVGVVLVLGSVAYIGTRRK